jgi:hypothetical protein
MRHPILTGQPGRDTNELISKKAAPVVDQTWSQASFQYRAARAMSRLSEQLTSWQEDYFPDYSVGEGATSLLAHFTTWSDLDTMQC